MRQHVPQLSRPATVFRLHAFDLCSARATATATTAADNANTSNNCGRQRELNLPLDLWSYRLESPREIEDDNCLSRCHAPSPLFALVLINWNFTFSCLFRGTCGTPQTCCKPLKGRAFVSLLKSACNLAPFLTDPPPPLTQSSYTLRCGMECGKGGAWRESEE